METTLDGLSEARDARKASIQADCPAPQARARTIRPVTTWDVIL